MLNRTNKPLKMEKMWNNDENVDKSKGLWQQIQEGGNVITWPPKIPEGKTLSDLWQETIELARKYDIQRREIMDKEYTPAEEITLEEIDKVIADYGGEDKLPKGIYAKIKIAGMYQEWPLLNLRNWLVAMKEEAKKIYEYGTG